MSSLAEFNRQIRAQTKDLAEKELVKFHKKLVLEMFRRIVMKTPVDTGRAKGNWNVTVNQTTQEVLQTLDETGIGDIDQSNFARALGKLAGLRPFSVVYISNNLDYIEFLEAGHSERQAPRGMVAITIEEINAFFS